MPFVGLRPRVPSTGMALRMDELPDPVFVEIDDDFSRLPGDEQARRTQEWLDSLRHDHPIELSVPAADLLAEFRAEGA